MRLTDYFHRKYWNPFSFVFESKGAPHARTLRTSISQKFQDAWLIISGINHMYLPIKLSPKSKAGLLDYAMLHIPTLVTLLKIGCKTALDNLSTGPRLILGLPLLALRILASLTQAALGALKIGLGFILAIMALPVIAVIQSVTYLIAHKDWKKITTILSPEVVQNVTKNQRSKESLENTFDASLNEIYKSKGGYISLSLLKNEEDRGIQVSIEKDNCVSVTVDKQLPVKYHTIELFKKSPFYRFNFAGVTQKFEKAQEKQNNIQFKK